MPNPTSKLNLVINGTTTQLDIHDSNAVDLTSNQTVGGNKEFTGTTTAHDLVPSATETYNFGSSSAQWNNAYIKSLTINGVACGDILTHNASEFVGVSSNQTIGGIKTFSNIIFGLGSQIILRRNDVERTVLPASTVYTAFSFSDKNGIGTSSRFSAVENVVKTNGDINLDLRAYDFSSKSNTHTTIILERKYDGTSSFYPEQNNTVNLGTSTNKWKSFNGLNPGALSLPGASVNVDTTNWDLTCRNELMGSFTPTADGWLMLHVANSGTNEVNFWIIGGVIRINNKSTLNTSDNRNFNMITIPIEKDKTYNIYGNASEYVAGRSIAYCRFMPCRGNV